MWDFVLFFFVIYTWHSICSMSLAPLWLSCNSSAMYNCHDLTFLLLLSLFDEWIYTKIHKVYCKCLLCWFVFYEAVVSCVTAWCSARLGSACHFVAVGNDCNKRIIVCGSHERHHETDRNTGPGRPLTHPFPLGPGRPPHTDETGQTCLRGL